MVTKDSVSLFYCQGSFNLLAMMTTERFNIHLHIEFGIVGTFIVYQFFDLVK